MVRKLTKKQKKQLNNFAMRNKGLVIALIFVIIAVAVVGYFLGWFDKWLKPEEEGDNFNPSFVAGKNLTTPVESVRDLKVAFIDVGQGDCIILQLPDGRNMMIDAGYRSSYTQTAIEEFTEAENIKTFDYLLLTHEDDDHCGKMAWVLENYEVKYIFRPNVLSVNENASELPTDFNQGDGKYSDTATYANTLVAMYNENCIYEIFDKDSDFENKIVCGEETYSYRFNFLTPTVNGEDASYDEDNDYSPIILFEYAGIKVLFTGDAGIDVIDEYMDHYGKDFNIDIYKVSHHGSQYNITEEFIEAIDPEYAIIQCGLDNKHTHPDKECLEILNNYDDNMVLYRNDLNGNIVLTITSEGVFDFELEKPDCSGNWVDGSGVVVACSLWDFVYNEPQKKKFAV